MLNFNTLFDSHESTLLTTNWKHMQVYKEKSQSLTKYFYQRCIHIPVKYQKPFAKIVLWRLCISCTTNNSLLRKKQSIKSFWQISNEDVVAKL